MDYNKAMTQAYHQEAKHIKALSIRSGRWMMVACLLALLLANSPLQAYYNGFNELPFTIMLGTFKMSKPLIIWMNEGFMAIFFFLIGLEIKHGLESGPLKDLRQVWLPIYGACGGMLMPGLIYALFNYQTTSQMAGWAIPVATDIAFSLAVLAMVTPGIQPKLRLFLSTLAIIDDIGAIVIIAVFYTDHLSLVWFLCGLGAFLGMCGLSIYGVKRLPGYFILALVLWYCLVYSGLHATLSGVLLAMVLPKTNGLNQPVTQPLLHQLEPWVNFMILPVFAFMNAGVNLGLSGGMVWDTSIFLGVLLGLFVGKPVGVMLFSWVSIRFKLAFKDPDMSWRQLWGVAALTGIGFTMSLFIGSLSFEHALTWLASAKMGILLGSLLSGLLGAYLLATK